jgi:microcystin-dependent protein
MQRPLTSAALAAALSLSCSSLAHAQDQYLGEIRLFGYNWCPVNWAPANGQILSIASNTALFSLYGTNFGGNGTTTFGLPNLIGRAPVSFGTGPLGQPFASVYGNTSVTLTTAQLPTHTHQMSGSSRTGTEASPSGALLGTFAAAQDIYVGPGAPADAPMSPLAIGMTGSSQPVATQSPALALNWCVAVQGIYPSRP